MPTLFVSVVLPLAESVMPRITFWAAQHLLEVDQRRIPEAGVERAIVDRANERGDRLDGRQVVGFFDPVFKGIR
jgi:hypothetical protein